jgi:hypothetical protein
LNEQVESDITTPDLLAFFSTEIAAWEMLCATAPGGPNEALKRRLAMLREAKRRLGE